LKDFSCSLPFSCDRDLSRNVRPELCISQSCARVGLLTLFTYTRVGLFKAFLPCTKKEPPFRRAAQLVFKADLEAVTTLSSRSIEYNAGSHEVRGSIPLGSTNQAPNANPALPSRLQT
jgi:hypothetical protein